MNHQDTAKITGDQIPEEIPNKETAAAIQELDNNGGRRFTGSTEQFFSELVKSSE